VPCLLILTTLHYSLKTNLGRDKLNPEKEKNYIDLTSRIKNNFKKFSEGQKLIATYLLKHSDKTAFLLPE